MKTLQLRVPSDKGRSKNDPAATASVPPRPPPTVEPSATQETPRPKRSPPADTPAVEVEPSPVIDITYAPKAFPPKERLLGPRARVLDPQFIVIDVSLAQIEVVLSLPPHFSVIFQALYESFFEQD